MVPTPPTDTSAVGGSATTQASSLDARAWQPRPIIAFAIRAGRTIVTLLASMVAVRTAAHLVPRPHTDVALAAWLVGLVAVSIAGVATTDRATRRLLPIAMLYQLSLVFPDEAPQRFSHALRSGGYRAPGRARGRREGAENAEGGARLPATPQEHAEHLLLLMASLTRHDRLTRGHTERVRAYTRMIGEEIGLSDDELAKLNWGALLHDIGKLDVPAELLNKNGRPTEDEWEVIRRHPRQAEYYVGPLRPWLGDWVDAATQHHERFDGGGYPAGLAATRISLSGRIVAIADAYDVMTSARSYKKPMAAAQARAELSRSAGSQFDPTLVRAFLALSLKKTRWIVGPLGWLAQLPQVLQVPVATALSSGGVAAMSLLAAAPQILVDDPPAGPAVELSVSAAAVSRDPAAPGDPQADANVDPAGSSTVPDDLARTATTGRTIISVVATVASTSTTASASTTTTAPTATAPPPSTTTAVPLEAPVTPSSAVPTEPPPPTAPPTTVVVTTTAPPTVDAIDDLGVVVGTKKNVNVRVLDNDVFVNGTPAVTTLRIVAPPHLGSVEAHGDHVQYDANATAGSDSFRYEICNSTGQCDQATVTLVVG